MKLFICGDSFCVSDPEYGENWANILENKLSDLTVINLSSSGASNYLIYLQVKEAIKQNANYIIYNATSSIRNEFKFRDDLEITDSVARYHNSADADVSSASMICGSWLYLSKHYSNIVNPEQADCVDLFFKNFVDLPNLIEKNFIFILHTLSLLNNSNLTGWAWSRGGFEHSNFKNSRSYWDFSLYKNKECSINLWDYYDPKKTRPWFHVTDHQVHQNVCNQYLAMLNLD
jgi:hypothetical protein